MSQISTICEKKQQRFATDRVQHMSKADRMQWFDEARFGLFLHWGLYSILSDPDRNEWVLFGKNLDHAEYNLLSRQFDAKRYDPLHWARLAKCAGMKYVVLTTRHHDGFCLFDTKTTSFNSVQTAAGRDLIAEYIAALRQEGLRVGLYYSIKSWQWPAINHGPGADPDGWEKMVNETHEQLRELMSNYGRIDLLWYDGCVVPGVQDNQIRARYWRSSELNSMIRSHQPHIIINDRSGLPEDFSTPEQRVNPPASGRRWESCMTVNQNWGYNIHDRQFKSTHTLKKALIRCARYGGNLLLGIGPRADGTIQDEFVIRLQTIGDWLQINEQAIRHSRRTDYTEAEHVAGPVTQRGNTYYFHLSEYAGPMIRLDGLGHATEVTLLGCDIALTYKPIFNDALEVSGFNEDLPWQNGPLVLKVTTDNQATSTANWLGGGDVLRITAGNAPVLGYDSDHYAPPVNPVILGHALAEHIQQTDTPSAATVSDDWCPGWKAWDVYTSNQQNQLIFKIKVPVKNIYLLDIGLVAASFISIRITINGQTLPETFEVSHPGLPDTWSLKKLVLEAGEQTICLQADEPFGFYAIRLNPCWRAMPAENWWTLGPFATNFAPQKPLTEVLDAMQKVYPPQTAFHPEAIYKGVRDIPIRWQHTCACVGQHSETGVNFPYHCGDQFSGVCFARTVIHCPEDRQAQLLIGCDWWANAWINGRMVVTNRDAEELAIDGAMFNGWKPRPAMIQLRKGQNVLLIKSHPGSTANWFTCRLSDPGDLKMIING